MKFLRRHVNRMSKLGKGRKKKQIWRRPTGRHNKMRLERRGVPANVKIGYKNTDKESEKVIYTLSDLTKLKAGDKAILGKVGAKKKMEIGKKAKEMKVELQNLNLNKLEKKSNLKKAKKVSGDKKWT